MRHVNVPVFIPHLGCPNQCVFCNQRSISEHKDFCEESVRDEIEQVLSTLRPEDQAEIAFFGGSFTGIDQGLMCRLLDLAQSYVQEGRVASIRLSTRPDYIDGEILSILSRYAVKTVELGLQSMDDAVLTACRRGHTAAEAEAACRAVVEAGFSLVGQMMIGLPASTPESEMLTAQKICELGASAVRIYPTVVFYDTPLCEMAQHGLYAPLSVEEAVERTAPVLQFFRARALPCIRVGLCATESLTSPDAVYAGPNHPALGEMILGECLYQKVKETVLQAGLAGQGILLEVPPRELSATVGQHRRNIEKLQRETGATVHRVVACEGLTECRVLPYPQKTV
jgi:histone acetyltransferase (RNA polymerase elongator complex component)